MMSENRRIDARLRDEHAVEAGRPKRPQDSARMMNFVLGIVAGALIAVIATIAAARHPEVQAALGLRPAANILPMAVSAPPRPAVEKTCATTPVPRVGTPEMLFSKRRFWSVAP